MSDLLAQYRALTGGAGSWTAPGLGQYEVTGADAHAWLHRLTTADISLLPPGRFVHTLLLGDDASIISRVTIYRFPDQLMLLVDAAQREAVWEHLVARKRGNVRLRDISDTVCVITVRGPAAATRLSRLLEPMPAEGGDVIPARLAGVDLFAARATLDGPEGFDFYCRVRDRASLESALAGAAVVPVDEAAWQLFRAEWGVARVGLEIDPDDTPVEAGLEGLVAEGKGAPFPGETALASRRRTGAIKRLVGFTVRGHDLPPIGAEVRVGGHLADRVRSVVDSPRVGIIGMTALPTSADAVGTPLLIEADGKSWTAEVARRPFVSRGTPPLAGEA
ncbi:MAG: glycine cleavage T C-terminal barrel domain-containing protein [Gemmatimonadales bacterium]|nr:glycine cleavage T C-terminal barrel domain-containing protein [Gemmatimonadales bacterium]